MLGPIVQNKHFGLYFKYNGKSLKAFKQDDMIQTIFQNSLAAVRGRTCSEQATAVLRAEIMEAGFHCG